MASKTRIVLGVLVALAIVVGIAVYLAYKESQCSNLEVTRACFLTNKILIDIRGECDKPITLKFYDDAGNLKAEVKAPVGGKTVVPVTPNLAPGEYRVEFYAGDKQVLVSRARVFLAPYLINAKAVAWPNGTIFIDYTSKSPPCLEDYGITTVIVRVNGTIYNETGFWRPSETIRIDLGVRITPDTIVIISMIDSLGQYYQNIPLAKPI